MTFFQQAWPQFMRHAQSLLTRAVRLVEPSRPTPSSGSSVIRGPSAALSSDAVAVPTFADFWRSREGRCHEIARLCELPPESSFNEGAVVDCLRRFCQICLLVPASQESHDHEPGGLVDHTLAVCFRTLVKARTSRAWNNLDRMALLLLCVCHDIGRILQVRVTATRDGRTETWNPEEPMSTWCERNRIVRLSITWIPGRPTLGAFAVEPMGMFFLPRVCPLGLPSIIGIDRCNALLYAFSRQIGVPAIDYHAPFKLADRECAARGKPVTGVPFPDAFWPALRAAIQSVAVTVNSDNADVYVSPTHAVVTLPNGKTTDGQAWSIACATLAKRVDVTDQHGLTDRMLSDATAPFLRWAGSDSCALRAKHVVVTDARPGKLAVVISNAVLWAEGSPSDRIPPCSARLCFVRPNGGHSITAAELGFQPHDHTNTDAHGGGASRSRTDDQRERAALIGRSMEDRGFLHVSRLMNFPELNRVGRAWETIEDDSYLPSQDGFDDGTVGHKDDETESDF